MSADNFSTFYQSGFYPRVRRLDHSFVAPGVKEMQTTSSSKRRTVPPIAEVRPSTLRSVYGPRRLRALAMQGLRRAGVGPWFDPLVLVPSFGRMLRMVTGLPVRARIVGDRVDVRFEPADDRSNGMSAFWGGALLLFEDDGEACPAPTSVRQLIGYLGLPDPTTPPEHMIRLQRFLPVDFIAEHQRRRWSDSGLYSAIR